MLDLSRYGLVAFCTFALTLNIRCACTFQDAGECLDEVPYYSLECSRDDVACLERKRRAGSKAVNDFFANPTSSPALLVFSL